MERKSTLENIVSVVVNDLKDLMRHIENENINSYQTGLALAGILTKLKHLHL